MIISNEIKISKNYNLTVWLYYLILLLISLSWTNKNLVEPNPILRYAFLLAFIVPFIKFPRLAPIMLTIFVSIRLFSIAPFGYLPSQTNLYFFLIIALFLYSVYIKLELSKSNKILYCLLFITLSSNLLNYANQSIEYDFLRLLIISILLSKLIIDEYDVKLIENGFVIVTFCLSIYELIFYKDFIVSTLSPQQVERMYWSDPNYLGCVLAIGLVIAFYYFINNNYRGYLRLFYLATCVIGFIAIGLFASRGAFIAVIIPIIYILYKRAGSFKDIFYAVLIIALLTYAFISVDFFSPLIARFKEDSLMNGSTRTSTWINSLRLFINSDVKHILIGGGSTYSWHLCGQANNSILSSPHNNFLEVLYDYGLVGIIAFISLVLFWVKVNLKNIIGISLILVFVISSMTLSPLMYLPFWFLIVLIESQKYKIDEEI
jgi:hypothetical protein